MAAMPLIADSGLASVLRMSDPPNLAPYATQPGRSRGRLHREAESQSRTPYQRDRDRIIHSTAFRRLQYKTQVFVFHEGDHYRTRLTHSLEVSQIARSICRRLRLNEDLAEALALAHDLGHTPFGHAGEDALDAAVKAHGGFDHNAQTLRLLTRLEHRYAEFAGLNLTWESLEGTVKHNGPLLPLAAGAPPLPVAIAEYVEGHDLELESYAGPEAQVAALSDDIAYNNHDIDDGLRAELFAPGDLHDLPVAGDIFRDVSSRYPNLMPQQLAHEGVRRLINVMVEDLIAETGRRLAALNPSRVEDVRGAPGPTVGFSDEMMEVHRCLKAFLFERMYRHPRVNEMSARAKRVVSDLYAFYTAHPDRLPEEWQSLADGPGAARTARRVADFIAGMTDRFALTDHRRQCGGGD